ncbi:MAG: PolC-type DNA polymerase III [Oscillospiraceae bacterium]|jgi:DNA polymerase-3 subunit alpha (Gram-positive type)|nr:PolC-type DNA polymerase III [Oscillospiraceae bacterium]
MDALPRFHDLFSDCPTEDGDHAAVASLLIHGATFFRDRRTMDITLSDPEARADDALLLRLERRLSSHYGLRHVRIGTLGRRPAPPPRAAAPATAAGETSWGRPPKGEAVPMRRLAEKTDAVVVEGTVLSVQHRAGRGGGGFFSFDLTDYSDSVRVATYLKTEESAAPFAALTAGRRLRVGGRMETDLRDKNGGLILRPSGFVSLPPALREDTAPDGRRVELHLHTRMSALDATTDVGKAVLTAARWGHRAVAVTDHGVLHAFPDAMAAAKRAAKNGTPIKILYGCEGYLTDDEEPSEEPRKRKARRRSYHIILLVKNRTGLKNLYKLVSLAHLDHFNYHPNIPRALLNAHREGLILGSACERGELFSAVVAGRDRAELEAIAAFYDYLEIQPLCNNEFMLQNGMARDMEQLRDFNRTVLSLGRALQKPVAATGDVHFLEPEDEIHRHMLLSAKKMPDPTRPLPLYFKTTDEMLAEFAYLGAEEARRVVVEDPGRIADGCEAVVPVRSGEFFPKMEGSADELRAITERQAHALYGDALPEILASRMHTELDAIIRKGYDIIYIIAQRLVARSLAEGYLVGSRGSVGSSIVAYLAGITEVNALPPHYRCPACRHWHFPEDPAAACGSDLPDYTCPVCHTPCRKDGFDIPFATFLGFDADKKPDIDLNFSGDYQSRAHQHTLELFGEGKVFRAGTIGTVAEKTATGFALKFLEEQGRTACAAEVGRLAGGCVGVKRTTGQHPGGLIIVPQENDIYEFCPVQHPADKSGDIITTHFDYHSIEENLLKLDLLGHDDPTMIRRLEELTGQSAQDIPLDDPDTMSLFVSSRALGFENDPVLGVTGACAIPEFGTRFVREMLVSTQPKSFDELVRISGLSHGTDVWLGNAADIIAGGLATLKDVICARDDIMIYLIGRGLDRKLAFTIMESVRKGKGLTEAWEAEMRAAGVPGWYIDACRKIKYMFPKAHAVAYVIMAFRIAWYKVHHPLAFYAAFLSIRAGSFDANLMIQGLAALTRHMDTLDKRGDRTAAEDDMLSTMEVCYELYRRGYDFRPVDIYASDATQFLPEGGSLRPPFLSIPGLGEAAALDIVSQREKQSFLSVEDLSARCAKVSKAHIEQLTQLGALASLPPSAQMNLFEMG